MQSELSRLDQTRSGKDSLAQLLRRPEVYYKDLPSPNKNLGLEEIQQVEIIIKYAK